jgi:hypothetical protein
MKKYKVRLNYRYGCKAEIKEVEIEKETDKSIWINGHRSAKISEWANYYDSWDEAKCALFECQQRYVDHLRLRLELTRQELENIKEMKK